MLGNVGAIWEYWGGGAVIVVFPGMNALLMMMIP